MIHSEERIPVLVGVGESVDRPTDTSQPREPLALMLDALHKAESDCGAALLRQVDAIDVVCEYSWPYTDAPSLLAHRLKILPGYKSYGEAGGESPVRFIHQAALRIKRGESRVAAVVGAEAAYTAARAAKSGVCLDWTERDSKAGLLMGKDFSPKNALDHGVAMPVSVYPLFENAALGHWGMSQREGLAETGRIWSEFSRVASANPAAWSRREMTPEEVVSPGPENRLIAWPYTKSVVANPLVNQGAAVLLTSLALARSFGIPDDKIVYLWGGAAANEPRDFLQRDQFAESHAQHAVLEASLRIAGFDRGEQFSDLELYSCFPCVPKTARRALKMEEGRPLSVTGGMSLFGGPLNNYMLHGAASMVRKLRGRADGVGLLYGQGEFVTKHHALVLASTAREAAELEDGYSVQQQADIYSGSVPRLLVDYAGAAALETYTVIFDRAGKAEFGVVIARTPAGERLMARVRGEDGRTLQFLTDLDVKPVGRRGKVQRLDEKRLQWSLC